MKYNEAEGLAGRMMKGKRGETRSGLESLRQGGSEIGRTWTESDTGTEEAESAEGWREGGWGKVGEARCRRDKKAEGLV